MYCLNYLEGQTLDLDGLRIQHYENLVESQPAGTMSVNIKFWTLLMVTVGN